MAARRLRLLHLHDELDACHACPGVAGPAVHGPPVPSPIFLLGQAPGPHEQVEAEVRARKAARDAGGA